MTTTYSDSVLFADLATRITGQLVLPDDPIYDRARQVSNGRVQTRPAAIVRCANV